MRLIPQGPILRGAAFVLDSILLTLVSGPTAMIMTGRSASVQTVALMYLGVAFVYFLIAEGVFATTLGKRCFGMRVVRVRDGAPCGLVAALVRTILRLVDQLFFCLPGLISMTGSRKHQRLGDRVARTMVVIAFPEEFMRVLESATPPLTGAAPEHWAGAPAPVVVPTGATPAVADGPPAAPAHDLCPFCNEPIRLDEIVCPACEHYVNQVTAYDETEGMAAEPLLYAENRGWRFDALWRLVFAGDAKSLEGVKAAVAGWPCDDRLLAVQAFAQVDDPRPLPFLDAMTHDSDGAVRALARNVRSRLTSKDSEGRPPG